MKILFTADIHIKLGQKNVPIEWAKNRYNLLISQLLENQADCDMFIIGGDIFDRMPTMEELEIYYDLVASITIPCIIYPGNHESLKRNTTFFSYLSKSTKRINKLVEVVDDYYSNDIFDIIPYNRLKEFNPKDFNNPILFTHVRGDIPPHVKSEIDLDLLNRWEIVLAGDLHSYENSQRNIIYPGSPVTTSFHRAIVDTGIVLLDTQTMEHDWIKLKLPQLIRKTIQAGEVMQATDYHHTIYEIEGDMAELGALEDSELIDKKVMKRESDTALILDPNMTLVDELREYLLYILQLNEETVDSVVHILNNNMDKFND